MKQQEQFNRQIDDWIKDINGRLESFEQSHKQMDILINNQECDHDTIRMLIDRVEELNEEVRHMRKLQALMADLTRLAIRNKQESEVIKYGNENNR